MNRESKNSSSPRDTGKSRPGTSRSRPVHTTEIKIVLPVRLEIPLVIRQLSNLRLRDLRRKRIIIITSIAVIGVAFIWYTSQQRGIDTPVAAEVRGVGLVKGTPEFETVEPAGKNVDDMGGWTRITPEGRDPAFAYVDTIGDVSLSVTQQPLPSDLASNPDEKVAKMASDFNAREKLSTGSTTVYIAASPNGPQQVILHKNNLLILIKSSDRVSNDQWVLYVESLK